MDESGVLSCQRSAWDVDLSFFFQAEDGIRDLTVTGVQTCALPILAKTPEQMTYRSTLRKRKSRENETIEQREIRLAKDRVNKRIKKSSETLEVREARLSRERERKRNKRTSRVLENIDEHLNRQDENNIINQQLPESDRK